LYIVFMVGNFLIQNLSTLTTTTSHENSPQEDRKGNSAYDISITHELKIEMRI